MNKISLDEIYKYIIITSDGELSFEEYTTREYLCGKKVGERDGISLAIELVKSRASELFLKGKDTEANTAREIFVLLESSLKKS